MPNHKGGKVYKNTTGLLPPGGDYREFDVYLPDPVTGRGPERVVVNIKTNMAWYSPNRYGDKKDENPPFIPMF